MQPRGVVWIGYEDGVDTLRARLEAASADLTRILDLSVVDDRPFTIPRDLTVLEVGIQRVDAALVVFDPFLAALEGKTDSHSDQSIRAALTPLKQLAERTNVAIVCIRHWGKARDRQAAHRGGGSVAITAAARAVWAFMSSSVDPGILLMARAKCNLARNPAGVRFTLEDQNGVPVVRYLGPEPRHADEILEGRQGSRPAAFLRDLLKDGPLPSEAVMERGLAAGFSRDVLFRHKDEAGVRAAKSGFSGGWVWQITE